MYALYGTKYPKTVYIIYSILLTFLCKKWQYNVSCLEYCGRPVVTINLVTQHFLSTECPVYMLGQYNYKAYLINFQE